MMRKLLMPVPETSAARSFYNATMPLIGSKPPPTVPQQRNTKQNSSLAARIHLCQKFTITPEHNCRCSERDFTPAGADEHSLARGGVRDGSVVVDEGGVKCHAIDVQGHRGELDTE